MKVLQVSYDAWPDKHFLTDQDLSDKTSVPVSKIVSYRGRDMDTLFMFTDLTPEELLSVQKLPSPPFLVYEEEERK